MTEILKEKGKNESERFVLLKAFIMMVIALMPFFVILYHMSTAKLYNLNPNEICIYETVLVNVDRDKGLLTKSNRSAYEALEKEHDVEYLVYNRYDGKYYSFNSQCFIDNSGRFKQFINKDGTDISAERFKEIKFTVVKNSMVLVLKIYAIELSLVIIMTQLIEILNRKKIKYIE